jgi:hypothetical protein
VIDPIEELREIDIYRHFAPHFDETFGLAERTMGVAGRALWDSTASLSDLPR